jgi:hypothetical protein
MATSKDLDPAANPDTDFNSKKYHQWEPENLMERLSSFWQNTVELNYVMSVAIAAMFFSSMVAVGYFLISYLLLFSMLKGMEKRIFWGNVIMGFKAFMMLSCVIWKVRKIDTMVMETSTLVEFKKEIRFYESLGFALEYEQDEYTGAQEPLNGKFIYSYYQKWSFFFEGIMIVMMIFFISYYRFL